MKLIMESWKKFLLKEAAKSVTDLEAADKLALNTEEAGLTPIIINYPLGKGARAICYGGRNEKTGDIIKFDSGRSGVEHYTQGKVSKFLPGGTIYVIPAKYANMLSVPKPNCLETFVVGFVTATTKGWGPLLYDVAMEYATMKGGGLVADRVSVTDAARNMWDFYMKNRGDVEHKQLDIDDEGSERFDLAQLTPDDKSDDCDQTSAM